MKRFKQSLQILRSTKGITISAMCIALSLILTLFRISIPPYLEITFSTLALAIAAYFLGMAPTILIAILADFLQATLMPIGPFFIGFTINKILVAIIYSTFFYQVKTTLARVLFARILVVLFIHLLLTPLWLVIMYGDAAVFLSGIRLFKQIILFPFDAALLYWTLLACKKIYAR